MVAAPPPSTPPSSPVAGQMTLASQHLRGRPAFLLTGERLVVSGVVRPFEAGQTVTVRFDRDGRSVATNTVSVLPGPGGAGRFRLGYSSSRPGLVQVSAVHAATPQMTAFKAKPVEMRVIAPDMREGARGPGVWLLQSALSALHYAVPLNGVFDEGTGQAVTAYRKLTGLARVPDTDAGLPPVAARSRRLPRALPAGRQARGGRSCRTGARRDRTGRARAAIYTMSSGKPSTPTVLGRFQVYLKTPGVNSEGMVDSNYFIRGYAIHGYPEVPTYAASHGCLRVPIPDAPAIYAWVRLGTPVDVYD